MRVAGAFHDIKRAEAPALIVCHGGVIRIALFQRTKDRDALSDRVPNATIVPLDPRGSRRIHRDGEVAAGSAGAGGGTSPADPAARAATAREGGGTRRAPSTGDPTSG